MPPIPTGEDPTESKPPVPKERRFKLSRACDRCRRRRIKCDEGHPCQSCLAANSPCTFEEPGKRTHPHKSKRAATLEDRMHHLESLIQTIPFNLFANSSLPLSPTSALDPSSPHASFASSNHTYPLGVPPPSLSSFPLMNPSTFFPLQTTHTNGNGINANSPNSLSKLAEETARMSLSPSYLYFDDEGYTRWQGESSGLPLLDLLVENLTSQVPTSGDIKSSPETPTVKIDSITTNDWFPDRQSRRISANPELLWQHITGAILPELMDSLVQCFLSTSYYLMPFLHVPTFLADYGNPNKWGETGFASFIVAICCLSSRHIDDVRVRSDPADGFSAGVQWFEMFLKLRTQPTACKPSLYTIQSVFVAAVYAIGLGRLSKGYALLAEAVTLSIDAGLHRSSEAYDCFDAVEDEVRKRTFWCVYMWDKQAAAAFGRPPMIRLRDCDVPEPAIVDDEYITKDGVEPQPAGQESRLGAFVATIRLFVVLEAVLDVPLSYKGGPASFLARATGVLVGPKRFKSLQEEEALLNEVKGSLPPYWAHTAETMASDNVIRVTQSERLHCLEQFTRMLIQRHRFSEYIAERTLGGGEGEQSDAEREAMMACHGCALQLVHAHMQVASKGLMTYYGVHVIHQLTQAGRSLIAILLNCKTEDLRPLVPPSLEALRSCVGLLRRFSGRYVCGLRSGDLIEEFCRLTRIPLDAPVRADSAQSRPAWIRPVRKKTPSARRGTDSSSEGSPEANHQSPSTFNGERSSPEAGSMPNFAPNMDPSSSSLPSFGLDTLDVDLLRGSQSHGLGTDVVDDTTLLMTMLGNDRSLDMGSLLSPGPNFFMSQQQPSTSSSDGGPGSSTAYPPNGRQENGLAIPSEGTVALI